MSVKEVLQSLVDDNLVDTDKIGTSIYFWAYPSKAMHTVRSARIRQALSIYIKVLYENKRDINLTIQPLNK